jgi:SAM-dependent methyltransferase
MERTEGVPARDTWEAGIERELAWWRCYLAGAGLDAPEEFQFRFDADAPLQPHIARALPAGRTGATPRLLDCAAGPATTLGKVWDGKRLVIVAIDALADDYQALLTELGLAPPVPTQRGEVERLDEQVAADTFDLVYMRFALDHCYDPQLALQQMVRATRPGGTVMIEHYRDATQELAGLRQWELRPEPGDLVVANPGHSFRVSEAVPLVRLEVEFSPTWLTMRLHKAG